MATRRVRIDSLLHERGLFASRSRAAASVLAGEVTVGPAGGSERVDKPGQLVAVDVPVSVDSGPEFVSRGGLKLANALDGFGLSVAGASALDVGASTGGFTDCLLQRGAARVAAVDVAYGQIDWGLRGDPRVTVIERVNARSLEASMLPFAASVIVIDVSFISLAKVLPAVLGCAADRFDCLAMVKPQFEVGRALVGKGGVVRDAAARRAAVVGAGLSALGLGFGVRGFQSSGLPGPKGNRETFAWLCEGSRGAGGLADAQALEAAAHASQAREAGAAGAAGAPEAEEHEAAIGPAGARREQP